MAPGTRTDTPRSSRAAQPAPRSLLRLRGRRLGAVLIGVLIGVLIVLAAVLAGVLGAASHVLAGSSGASARPHGAVPTSPAVATSPSPPSPPHPSPTAPSSSPSSSSLSSSPASAGQGTPAAAPTVSAKEAHEDLRAAVRAADKGIPGQLSVAVTDLRTGVTASYGAPGHGFATASIVKADILSTLLLQRHGRLSSSQRSIARRMIEHSDNDAASALWRTIGQAHGLDEANERFGMTSTHGGRGSMWGTTTTTAQDQLQLLRTIFTEHSALPAASRAYIRSLMGDVEPDQDWGVSAADTRSGERYFVKNGWLPRTATGLWVVNSVGSVQYHGHPLLITALSDGRHSMGEGVRVLEKVSRGAAAAVTGR